MTGGLGVEVPGFSSAGRISGISIFFFIWTGILVKGVRKLSFGRAECAAQFFAYALGYSEMLQEGLTFKYVYLAITPAEICTFSPPDLTMRPHD